MIRKLSLVLLLVAIVSLTWDERSQNASAQVTGWQQKVDPLVLTAAAAGPTEFLVALTQQADLSGAATLKSKPEKGRYVFDTLTAVAAQTQPGITSQLDLLGASYRRFWIVNAIWVRGNLSIVQAMAERSDVSFIYPAGSGALNLPGGIEASESSTLSVGSNIAWVKADQVWALGFTGQGVVVAGADTGVAWTHNALKNQYRGWNGTTANHNYNWHDAIKNPNTGCPGSSPEPCDDDVFLGGGHGTHTVGTMVGNDGGINQIGMAPGAEWIACRNMNNGVGAVPTYLECMEWFIAPTDANGNNPDPSKAPHVINNSWGCVEGCASPLLKQQIDASRAAGIVYVVSAGNEGDVCSSIAFPLAVYQSAFTVGATNNHDDGIAGFSSRGPVLTNPLEGILTKPNISAPGVSVRSSLRNGSYGNLSGTSMAGPHVAGLVALILSANPCLAGKVDRIEDIIEQSAVHLTTTEGCGGDTNTQVPNNTFGWGRIDALAAVQLAIASNHPPVAANDQATTSTNTPVKIQVLANDTDPDEDSIRVTSVTQGAKGSVTSNPDGTVTYTPNNGFSGQDSFTYTISDCAGASSTASVTVLVEGQTSCVEIDDSDVAVEYKGGWHLRESSSASNGAYHRRLGNGNNKPTARVTFNGNEISYFYVQSNMGGSANIFIDGILRETLSYGASQSGPENPTFGHSRTYSGLGTGAHQLVIEHVSGAVYVDGFSFGCNPGAGADASAAAYHSETEVNQTSGNQGLVWHKTIQLGANDREISVVVEGAALPVTVQLLDPKGLLLASGGALIQGLSASGLDANISKAGNYTVKIPSVPAGSQIIQISIARTVQN